MIPEREREALMRLTMCAREECGMCKYKETCDFDFQYETATRCMNILADALNADRKTEPTSCKTCRYGEVDEGYVRCAYYSKADSKPENSSEKPNNCEDKPQTCYTCEYEWRDGTDEPCVYCYGGSKYKSKDEPTISKMEQVETMSCAECKHRPIGAEICEEPCHYEPQTDWHYDEQDATWYPYKHEDEPQTDCPWK